MNTATILTKIKLLAVSFSFPPLVYPRSIQVARLLKHLPVSTVLVCADERRARKDSTLEPDAEARLEACLRVPFRFPAVQAAAEKLARTLSLPILWKNPDRYISWNRAALNAIKRYCEATGYRPDLLVTFGQPMSVHLIGLALKERYRLPWVAHFSDPWADNPINKTDPLTKAVNRRLEKKVLGFVDRAVFTCQQTVDLVQTRYPKSWGGKFRVLPHAFDPGLYPSPPGMKDPEITIRHVGNFYRSRSPKPLFHALARLHQANRECLADVVFELIGVLPRSGAASLINGKFPEGLVRIKASVPYRDSLGLMASAEGLLVIDAPAEKSVFLPSKLIDYIGAGRPILGLTPPGASGEVIRSLGGWVADPSDIEAVTSAVRSFLLFLRQRSLEKNSVWGDPDVRRRYTADCVAEQFVTILQDVLHS